MLSPTPLFFAYRRPVDHGVKAAAVFNDLALEICAPAPDRLVPFCQVPLQDPDAACRELDRCLANGHVGVEIGNHIEDRDLDDEGTVTFLQHCATVQAPVFVHPWGMDRSPRLNRWMARWLAAMPAETHLSLLAMILGGVFDRVPESLRICFAHGGGSFAFWLGRTDNAWHRRPDLVATSDHRRRTTCGVSTWTRWCSPGRCGCWSTRSVSTGSCWAAIIRSPWGSVPRAR